MNGQTGWTLGALTALILAAGVALAVALNLREAPGDAALSTPVAALAAPPSVSGPPMPASTAGPELVARPEPVATLAPATTSTAVPPARAAGARELYVDVGAPQGTLNPMARGAAWGPLWPLSLQMTPLVQELGIGLLSFPGGEYGDSTNLQQIEIDRFIELCRTLAAEPLIHVRLPGGSPEQAAALLNYTNKQKNYGVRYWAIGNEPNLYPGRYTGTAWDAAYFATEWRRFAETMRSTDPTIQLVGPEITQFAGTEGVTRSDELLAAEWMRTFLEVNGDLVDIVSIHRYPFPHDMRTATTVDDLLANPPEWDEQILPDLRALIVETVGHELPIAITEINSHWTRIQRQDASPDSLMNAIWWGDVWIRLARQRVSMVAFWSLTSRDDQGAWGIVGKYAPRPVAGTFVLTKQLGEKLVWAEVGAEWTDEVSALATWREDGALTILLSNRSSSAAALTPAIENLPEGTDALAADEVWRVDEGHAGTLVAEAVMGTGDEWLLPARSLTLLVLR